MKQEITNNIDLRVCHSDYLINNTGEDEKQLQVFIWMDGIYYIISEGAAYVYAFDYGYSEADLPKALCGYEISDEYLRDTKSRGDSSFPISLKSRIDLAEVWKEVEEVKAEYEKSPDAAIEAYEQYLSEEAFPGVYYLICVNNDDVPELLIDSGIVAGGQMFLSYADGKVNAEWLPYGVCAYIEKENLFALSHGRMGYYGDCVYNITDGKLTVAVEGNYSEGIDNDTWNWNGDEVSRQEYNAHLNKAFPGERASGMKGYSSLQEAYGAFTGKVTAIYSMEEYLISNFEISDGKLTVESERNFYGIDTNTICYEISPDCDWYESDVTGARLGDTTYETLKAEIEKRHGYYAQDRENAIIESPKGIIINVENGVIVEVYGIIS